MLLPVLLLMFVRKLKSDFRGVVREPTSSVEAIRESTPVIATEPVEVVRESTSTIALEPVSVRESTLVIATEPIYLVVAFRGFVQRSNLNRVPSLVYHRRSKVASDPVQLKCSVNQPNVCQQPSIDEQSSLYAQPDVNQQPSIVEQPSSSPIVVSSLVFVLRPM
ncbi:hypothetical protein V6N13_125970 [Hibiscus sabdariffa]